MGFREVGVVEVREVLRAWLEGYGLRTVASRAGVDRKTARWYVAAAEAAGLSRDAGSEGLTESWSAWWWRRSGRRGRTGTAHRGSCCWATRTRSAAGLHRR